MTLSDDDLRARLRALDPAARPAPARRRPVPGGALPGAAAALLVVLATALAVVMATDDAPAPSSMTLALPAGGPSTASCLPVTAEFLADMPVAFAGTAVEETPDAVVLRVDRWYEGGSAREVVLTRAPDGMAALIGQVDLRPGEEYLVTATGGTVNACGFSGPRTPELERLYRQAFGG